LYEIDLSKTDLFEVLELNKNSPKWKQLALNKINKAHIFMKLDDVGHLSMIYYKAKEILADTFNDNQDKGGDDEEEGNLKIEVYGFKYQSSGRVFNIKEHLLFPLNARKDVDDIINDQLRNSRSVIEQL